MTSLALKQMKQSFQSRLYRLPQLQSWRQKRRFQVERALLHGEPIAQPTSSHSSILHFSVNKAATQYVKRILMRCAAENGLTAVRMSEYAWHNNIPYLFTLSAEEVKPYLHIFQPRGYLYTVFGGLVKGIPNVEEYHAVIMLRDPRDVLVSSYFSYAFSHALPEEAEKRESVEQFREYTRSLGVDGYVVNLCTDTRQRYEQYLHFDQTYPHVYLTRYEEMLADFPTWLDALLDYCQLEISPRLKEDLLSKSRTSGQNGEDVSKHRRQATPGDYLRKLKPETIKYLNTELAHILERLDYVRDWEIERSGDSIS